MAIGDAERRFTVLHRARFVLLDWLRHTQKASPAQVARILRLLDEKYLLEKRVKSGIRRSNSPAGLRFLFYHHTANILHWRERRPEGHPLGFSESVYRIFREEVWPDVNITAPTVSSVETEVQPCSNVDTEAVPPEPAA